MSVPVHGQAGGTSPSARIISYHFTKAAAHQAATRARRAETAARRAETANAGRSSGWSRLDHRVVASGRLFRRWAVQAR